MAEQRNSGWANFLELAIGVTLVAAGVAVWAWLVVFHTAALFILVAVLYVAIALARAARVRSFARAHEGKTFVLFSRRHGWHDFVRNNVEPVLPERWEVVWFGPTMFPDASHNRVFRRLAYRQLHEPRPVAVRLEGQRLQERPLRTAMEALKLRGVRRDPDVQAEVSRILRQAF